MNDNAKKEGFVVASVDSDWVGLYSTTGETRSRLGSIITLDGIRMPVACIWASQHQTCVGTSYKEGLEEAEMAQSRLSAEAELYAQHCQHSAADTIKLALHLS